MMRRIGWASLLLALVAACGSDSEPEPLMETCESLESPGTEDLDLVNSTVVGTIAAIEESLSSPGIDSPSTVEGEAGYAALGFGNYQRSAGWDRVQRTDLGGTTDFGDRRSLAYFAQLTDLQFVDDESPVRLAALDNSAIGGAMRPQEAYLGHALSAMNRTLTRIMNPSRPYDFGIITGDVSDSAQRNEIRWVIDIMDGAPGVHVDSGDDDDPVPGPDNDPKDPFDPVAFPAPWLYVFGNHDVHVVGFQLIKDWLDVAIGTRPTIGTRDYAQYGAPVVNTPVPADPNRELIDQLQSISELHMTATSPGPVGHGFPQSVDVSNGANYSYDAIEGLVRVVQLDTTDPTGGELGLVRQEQVDEFLVPALDQAASDGVLVILASHHSTTAMDTLEGRAGEPLENAVEPEVLEELVASYPNVVLWLVGHNHDNRIHAVAGPGMGSPGYWEIMSSALADWPNQSRVVEIVDNGNGTLSIFATAVDFDEAGCLERRFRRLSVMDFQSGWSDPDSADDTDRNVELVIPMPASAEEALAAAHASLPSKIESLTTLAQ